MKLEQQVCSLELAKKLKELEVKQESLFCWNYEGGLEYVNPETFVRYTTDIAAFTVAELWELCPWDKLVFSNIDKDWKVQWQANGHTENDVRVFESKNGADAMAKMLIYLLENNLTPASQDKPKE